MPYSHPVLDKVMNASTAVDQARLLHATGLDALMLVGSGGRIMSIVSTREPEAAPPARVPSEVPVQLPVAVALPQQRSVSAVPVRTDQPLEVAAGA